MKAAKHARQLLLWIPTTKIRILVSIALSIAVVFAAIFKDYRPSWELLAFLLIQQGLDISQYAVKRTTPAEDPTDTDHNLNILPKEVVEEVAGAVANSITKPKVSEKG